MLKDLLSDGSKLGISLSYAEQPKPEGIAQAFLIGEKFIGDSPVCLILGDNVFYGADLIHKLESAARLDRGARVFVYHVNDPERYGGLEMDSSGKPVGIEEKPEK